MFYLGNDQHARQITICLRDESGDIVEKRQVSTEPDKIRAFLADLRERTAADGGYLAIVEVCGFNDWYLDLLKEMGCREVIFLEEEAKQPCRCRQGWRNFFPPPLGYPCWGAPQQSPTPFHRATGASQKKQQPDIDSRNR